MAYTRKPTSSNLENELFLRRNCVLDDAFEAYGGRWTTNILFCIRTGGNRFGLIRQRLKGISDHVLGLRLKRLHAHGLVSRTTDGEILYALTPDGRALVRILERLARWQTGRAAPSTRKKRS